MNNRRRGIIGIVLSVVLVVVIVAMDSLCYLYSDLINLYFRTTEETDISDIEDRAAEVTTKINAEGSVLLKNEDDALPISGKVNLFGVGSYQMLYLGTGSAGGWNWDSDSCVDLKTALESVDIEVNEDLWQFYIDNYTENAGQTGGVTDMTGASHNIVEQPMSAYSDDLLEGAKSYSDTAILVFSRAGGEGSDAVMDMTGMDGGDAGKSYLELQDVEIELLDYVRDNYANVIILINTPMAIELGFVDEVADTGANTAGDVDAALWIGMPGTAGTYGIAEILAGQTSPSGRLTDTWAYEVESAPSYYNFGDFTYTNGEDDYSSKYVHYLEGIYVGYRWYETANAENVNLNGIVNYNGESKDFDFGNYDSIVQYPFGYGLSYTTFSQEWDGDPSYDDSSEEYTFNIKVTNTGSVASKTPVELYVEQPYTTGGTEKSKVELAAYTKTDTIEAGESETVTITVAKDDLSSYDYDDNGSYVLDAGDYTFYSELGTNGAHCWAADDGSVINWTTSIDQEIFDESNPRSSDQVAAVNQFDDVTAGDGTYSSDDYLTRADFEGTFPKAFADSTAECDSDIMALMTGDTKGAVVPDDDTSLAMPDTDDKSTEIYMSDMVGVAYDDSSWETLIDRMSVDDMVTMTGACGWQNPAISSIRKKACVDMDGAEGLHDLVNDASLTMFNCSVLTAATWNVELAEEMGSVYGEECNSQNVTGMYGFSMDLHRSPFGGRAFEYYSEDPLLSGLTAAAQTSGIQSKGVAVYMKHFVANDQETNRGGVHVWMNEQALRELYLRSFEECTKNATNEYSELMNGSSGVMTSYNAIGTSWSSANYGLCTTVLRDEWGFTGRIVTDAVGNDGYNLGDYAVRAGTDMFLSPMGAVGRYSENTTGTAAGVTALQSASKHILYVYANTAAAHESNEVEYNTAWIAIPIIVSILLLIAIAVIIFRMVLPGFGVKVGKSKKDDQTAQS